MKLQKVLLGAVLVTGMSVASAEMRQLVYDAYTLDYENSTVLGDPNPSLSFNGGSGLTGFGWSLNSSIKALSTSGNSEPVISEYQLPDFTITARPGWTLGGALSSFLGNIAFTEIGLGATTSIQARADVTVDGMALPSAGGFLTKSVEIDDPELNIRSGFFGDSATAPYGSFNSLKVSNFYLTLTAEGSTALIVGQNQNRLEFSFTAAPVPEPEAWALLMAGLGLVGYAARRRSTARR